MERLTKRGHKFNLTNVMEGLNGYIEVDEILNRLAQHEDLEEQGLLMVLPCKVERIKDAVQKLYESNGCLYSDIGLSHDYGDCSQGCYQCVVDGPRAEAEEALKGGTA